MGSHEAQLEAQILDVARQTIAEELSQLDEQLHPVEGHISSVQNPIPGSTPSRKPQSSESTLKGRSDHLLGGLQCMVLVFAGACCSKQEDAVTDFTETLPRAREEWPM